MRQTARHTRAVAWHHLCWIGACLCLLLTSCTTAPLRPPATPLASGQAQGTPLTAYHGHTSTVYTVSWSPNGTRIASGGNDSTVQIWDARTGHRLVLYTGHTGTVYTLAWSPDGTRIAAGGNDNTVQVWDATSGRRLLTYTGHTAGVRAIAWSPDGTRIVSASQDGTVQVWDAVGGHHLLTYQEQARPLWAVAWSPSGACIASATGNTSDELKPETVQVWNATTGHRLSSYPVPSSSTSGEFDGTFGLEWSPDGTLIASGGADTMVHLWNAPSC